MQSLCYVHQVVELGQLQLSDILLRKLQWNWYVMVENDKKSDDFKNNLKVVASMFWLDDDEITLNTL